MCALVQEYCIKVVMIYLPHLTMLLSTMCLYIRHRGGELACFCLQSPSLCTIIVCRQVSNVSTGTKSIHFCRNIHHQETIAKYKLVSLKTKFTPNLQYWFNETHFRHTQFNYLLSNTKDVRHPTSSFLKYKVRIIMAIFPPKLSYIIASKKRYCFLENKGEVNYVYSKIPLLG